MYGAGSGITGLRLTSVACSSSTPRQAEACSASIMRFGTWLTRLGLRLRQLRVHFRRFWASLPVAACMVIVAGPLSLGSGVARVVPSSFSFP
jgi:hypothetical protein